LLVNVNGREHSLPEFLTLGALLRRISPPPPFAVARNAEVVPRGAYEACALQTGDRIEIVHPAAGG
jgi:sulfur carrier protein